MSYDSFKNQEKLEKKEERKWLKKEKREYKKVCRMIEKENKKGLGNWLREYGEGKIL